ncbi:MAG: NUDIX hydrolase [Gemmatimonadaceae bacterium]|nr:NUDIX hydrolase [Gemmatimonadaceae bacterium]
MTAPTDEVADRPPASEGASRRGGARRRRRGRAKKLHIEVSAGGIVVRRVEEGYHFLLIRDGYRKWGFPKGHLQENESADVAAIREVQEETGIHRLRIRDTLTTIDWRFRFRGKSIHKTCHFFLMETEQRRTKPQASEGITACRWVTYDDAVRLIAYANAKGVLAEAQACLVPPPAAASEPAVPIPDSSAA